MARRRTKKAYQDLFDTPSALFGTCEVILFPNGEPVIWVKSRDGCKGFEIKCGEGPAGLSVDVRSFVGGPVLTVQPGPDETEDHYASVVQYNRDSWTVAFRKWLRGEGEYPGDKPAK